MWRKFDAFLSFSFHILGFNGFQPQEDYLCTFKLHGATFSIGSDKTSGVNPSIYAESAWGRQNETFCVSFSLKISRVPHPQKTWWKSVAGNAFDGNVSSWWISKCDPIPGSLAPSIWGDGLRFDGCEPEQVPVIFGRNI